MQMSLFTQPAAFYRKGSSVGEDFRDELRREELPRGVGENEASGAPVYSARRVVYERSRYRCRVMNMRSHCGSFSVATGCS